MADEGEARDSTDQKNEFRARVSAVDRAGAQAEFGKGYVTQIETVDNTSERQE